MHLAAFHVRIDGKGKDAVLLNVKTAERLKIISRTNGRSKDAPVLNARTVEKLGLYWNINGERMHVSYAERSICVATTLINGSEVFASDVVKIAHTLKYQWVVTPT